MKKIESNHYFIMKENNKVDDRIILNHSRNMGKHRKKVIALLCTTNV